MVAFIVQSTIEFDSLIVDLNSITFLDTDDLVVLACLLDSFYNG